MTHVFYNRVRARDFNIFFAIAGSARRTYVLVRIASCSNDRGIADPARNFPGKATGCSTARHFSFLTERGTMDGSGRWENHATNSLHAEFWRNTDFNGYFFHSANAKFPLLGMSSTA